MWTALKTSGFFLNGDVTNKGKGGTLNRGANEEGEKERVRTEGLYIHSKLFCMLFSV